jgi:hypothetical protein
MLLSASRTSPRVPSAPLREAPPRTSSDALNGKPPSVLSLMRAEA